MWPAPALAAVGVGWISETGPDEGMVIRSISPGGATVILIDRERKARLMPLYFEWEDEAVFLRAAYGNVTSATSVRESDAITVTVTFTDREPLVMRFSGRVWMLAEAFAEQLAKLAGQGETSEYYERSKTKPQYAGLTFNAWFTITLVLCLAIESVVFVARGTAAGIGLGLLGIAPWLVFRALAEGWLEDREIERENRGRPVSIVRPAVQQPRWARLGRVVITAPFALGGALLLPGAAFLL